MSNTSRFNKVVNVRINSRVYYDLIIKAIDGSNKFIASVDGKNWVSLKKRNGSLNNRSMNKLLFNERLAQKRRHLAYICKLSANGEGEGRPFII